MTSRWTDSPARYGLVTRLLHWGIALLLLWQFSGMAIKNLLGRGSELAGFMVGTHQPIGTILMILIAVRAAWAFSQWRKRPPHPPTLLGKAATAGHALLYALMLYIPFVALLRAYGGTRAFAPWGIPLFPAREEAIEWMQAPANASHGLLAWTLLVVILGHIAMVVVHQWWMRDGTLERMTGRLER